MIYEPITKMTEKAKKILLVEPDFPYPTKSKNMANSMHKNFVPIGLLKLGALHKDRGDDVSLVRGNLGKEDIKFKPHEILITTLFTYWSKQVWDCVEYYRTQFPSAAIKLGGIYATLHLGTSKFNSLKRKYQVKVLSGVIPEAEDYYPDYSLIPEIEYHATHMMRGCIRKCAFCGTWKIEPKLKYKNVEQITTELKSVGKNKVIFYDNNLLANPYIKEILKAFTELKINERSVSFESQSGFDGRLLLLDPELPKLIKEARFTNIRIAWDNGLNDKNSIKKQIELLTEAGYNAKDISVFMIYNFSIPYEDMLKKIDACYDFGVQITDCRNRPLDWDFDDYKPHKRNGQPEGSFYIHKEAGWTDKKIRSFRKKVRVHNIEIRYAKDKGLKYDPKMEKWSTIHNLYKYFNLGRPPQMVIIENSSKEQKKIEQLTRLRTFCNKLQINPPDFSNLSKRKLDSTLKYLFEGFNKLSEDSGTEIKYLISNISNIGVSDQ